MPRAPFLSSSTPPGSSSLLGIAGPSKTATKSKKRKAGQGGAVDKENEQVKAPGSTLTQDHVRSFLANYDLEAENRIRQLQRQLELSTHSANHAAYLQLERVPSTVKEATVEEFLRRGNGKIRTFLASRPIKHLDQSQEEWERAKRRKAWDSADAANSADAPAEGLAPLLPPATSSSGVAADSEASSKPAKKPPVSRKAGAKTTKNKGAAGGSNRLTRRTSVVLRTQQGDEFDVDTASTSQLEEMGLSEKDVADLRSILLKLKA